MASISSPAISSPGVGSGLDVKSIVSQLVALERRPIDQLQVQQSATQAKLSSFGLLQSYTNNLLDAAKKLALPGTWSAATSSSADTSAVAAATSGTPTAAGYSLEVSSLARAQSLASPAFASSASTFGAGTLTLQLGGWTPGSPPSFAANSASSPVTVTVNAGDSLSTVRDAINAAGAGVRASIVNDGTGARLVVRSQSTGAQNAVRITSSGDASLGALSYSPDGVPAGSMTETSSAADAAATINGLPVTSASNTLTDAIEGVTLTLKQVTTAPVEVTVAADTGSMRKAIDDFVKAYNDLNGYLNEQTKYDPDKKLAGPLQGDSAARALRSQLRGLIQSPSAASTSLTTLSTAGLELQRDGSLKVNETNFGAALASPSALSTAFAADNVADSSDGFGVRFVTLATALSDSDGLLQTHADAFKSQIDRQSERIASLEQRVALIQDRLLKQYNSLDAKVGQLNGLSTYVGQQITAWNRSSR